MRKQPSPWSPLPTTFPFSLTAGGQSSACGGTPLPSSRAAHLQGMAQEQNCELTTPYPSVGGACPPTTISRGVCMTALQRGWGVTEKEDEKEANSWEQGQDFVLGAGEKSLQPGFRSRPLNCGRPRQAQSLKATGEVQPSQGPGPLKCGEDPQIYRTSPWPLMEAWVLGLHTRQDSRTF